MKMNKFLIILVTTLAFVITIFGATSANASKWHKGVPKAVSNHSWITGFKKLKPSDRYQNEYYLRYYAVSPSKDIGFDGMSLFYDKNKKYITSGSGVSNDVPFPFYKKVGKKTYKVITGLNSKNKRSLKHDLKEMKKYHEYTLIKVHNKHKISVWYVYKDLDRHQVKKQFSGVYYKTNKNIML